MSIDTKNLSPEVAAYIKALKDENERLKQQNANLTEQIIRNQKKMYGKSSEQIRYIYMIQSNFPFSTKRNRNILQVPPNPQRKLLLQPTQEKQNALRLKSQKILNTKK